MTAYVHQHVRSSRDACKDNGIASSGIFGATRDADKQQEQQQQRQREAAEAVEAAALVCSQFIFCSFGVSLFFLLLFFVSSSLTRTLSFSKKKQMIYIFPKRTMQNVEYEIKLSLQNYFFYETYTRRSRPFLF